MKVTICRVIELVGPDRAVRRYFIQLCSDTLGSMGKMIRVFQRHGRNQVQSHTIRFQRVDFVLALIVGHDDNGFIAESIADYRQANARVACSALDDDATRSQFSSCLGIPNYAQCGAILD